MSSRRMPAEWEAQRAVLLAFPRRDGDWEGILDQVASQHLDLCLTIAQYVAVVLLVPDLPLLESQVEVRGFRLRSSNVGALQEAIGADNPVSRHLDVHALETGTGGYPIFCVEIPLNDVWARDFGPITIVENGTRNHLDFQFNGWGNKYPAELDNSATRRLVEAGIIAAGKAQTVDFVLEGGSLESNGAGILLSTRQCLLHPERNPQFSEKELRKKLKNYLGADQILLLDHGHLEGDDTDAHIDTLARFIAEDTIVYQSCDDPSDVHFPAFSRMEEQLQRFKQLNGMPFHLVPLPWPPAHFSLVDGRRLPATFANFLITNGAVLIPGSGTDLDAVVVQLLTPFFPNRKVLTVPTNFLLEQHGSIHCLTMQLY